MKRKITSPIHCGRCLSLLLLLLIFCEQAVSAQSIQEWYDNAQQRIDTLRKGTFGLKIIDRNDQPYTGDFSVRMVKHEFPFGIAFDLYEGAINNGNVYTTTSPVIANSDAEIYQSERWYSYIAYAIPVEKDRNFNLTLKFAEIYFNSAGSRIFDVFVEGTKYLSDFDMFAEAGGQYIAIDTTIQLTATDTLINIEFVASLDNAAPKGIEIETVEGDWITRINCGGGELTTIDGNHYLSDEDFFDLNAPRLPSEEQWMKAAMQKYFNYGVSGNSFKWSGIQPQHTPPNYTAFDNAVNWTQSIGWELRAHTLLWGGYNYEDDHALPRWVKDLPTPQAITDTCKMRVVREVSRYRGIVREYDVMNEPLHATYLSSIVGDSINWNCFKWARSADPDAELFINDYNVEYNWGDAAEYRDMILDLKSKGAPITGVGMQAHFWQDLRPQVTELVTNINIVAEAGLPIKLTEFDNGIMSQEDQASDLIMVLTVAFSHPSINGIISWALSDRGAWREESGYFDANHEPKLAADTLYHYTRKLWATNFDSTAAGADSTLFNAYYGNYTVEVTFNDTVKVFSIPCLKENEDSVFVLFEEDAILKGPELVSKQLLNDSTLQLSFNKKMDYESIRSGDFKFFSDNALRIQKLSIDSEDTNSVNIVLHNPIMPDDFLCVSYFPGILSSTDGAKALAFGPETITNLTRGLVSAEVTNDGTTIEARFNGNIINLDDNIENFDIWINDVAVDITDINLKSGDSSIAVASLSVPVVNGDEPVIQYTKGDLTPSEGFNFQSSGKIAVSNIWPELDSAYVNNTGVRIDAAFGIKLVEVEENMQAFSVTVNDQIAEIGSIIRTGTDSSHIIFNLAEAIQAGQAVKLSYTPGTIKGYNGNSMAAFENEVVQNNSTVTGLEQISFGELRIYPNPADGVINIDGNTDSYTLLIYNIRGVLVQQHLAVSQITSVDVSSYLRGTYIVQIIDNSGAISTGKIILQ